VTPGSATVLALALFPTGDHHELALGSYAHLAQDTPISSLTGAPLGLDVRYRRVFDTDNPDTTPTGEQARLRLYRNPDGSVDIDHLEVETLLATVRIRPELGDKLDVGLLLGTWDEVWLHGDSGRSQWRVHTPITLTLLGLSNNDMDTDDRVKWYAAGGIGVGGAWIARLRGPPGLQARADVGIRSTNRWRSGEKNATRHELSASGELGLSVLWDQQAWIFGGWVEHITQWDPRDTAGRDGVDRQYVAGGLSVSLRLYQGRRAEPEPDLGVLVGELEAAAALAELEEARSEGPHPDASSPDLLELLGTEAPPDPAGPETAEAPSEPDPEVGPLVEGDPASPDILTVHWSELEVTEQALPRAPEGLGDVRCTLRFVLDPEGVPTEVIPARCPEKVLERALEAGLRWRFEPFVDGDRPIPVQVVFPIPFQDAP